MDQVYVDLGGAWSRKQFAAQINRCAEGQICIEDNGRVVAVAISMVVEYDRFGDKHSYQEITDNGFLTNHDPNGNVLYGVDVFVHPNYRDMRLGRRLYGAFRRDRGREQRTLSPPSEPCVRFSRTRLSSWLFPHRDWLASAWASVKVKRPRRAE